MFNLKIYLKSLFLYFQLLVVVRGLVIMKATDTSRPNVLSIEVAFVFQYIYNYFN